MASYILNRRIERQDAGVARAEVDKILCRCAKIIDANIGNACSAPASQLDNATAIDFGGNPFKGIVIGVTTNRRRFNIPDMRPGERGNNALPFIAIHRWRVDIPPRHGRGSGVLRVDVQPQIIDVIAVILIKIRASMVVLS